MCAPAEPQPAAAPEKTSRASASGPDAGSQRPCRKRRNNPDAKAAATASAKAAPLHCGGTGKAASTCQAVPATQAASHASNPAPAVWGFMQRFQRGGLARARKNVREDACKNAHESARQNICQCVHSCACLRACLIRCGRP